MAFFNKTKRFSVLLLFANFLFTGFAEKFIEQAEELKEIQDLQFGFPESLSDVRSHNRIVLGTIQALEQDFYLIKKIKPFLYTHIGIFLQISENNNASTPLNLLSTDGAKGFAETELWLKELAKLKTKNSNLKLLGGIQNSLAKISEIATAHRRRNVYYAAVYEFLRNYNFDGIVIDILDGEEHYENIRLFACGLREYMIPEILIRIVGSKQNILAQDIGGLTQCVNYIILSSPVNSMSTSFLPEIYLPNPNDIQRFSIEGAVALLLNLGVPPGKIAVSLGINGVAYTLSRTDSDDKFENPDYFACCGQGEPATLKAAFPELGVGPIELQFIYPFQLCSLNNSKWQTFRSLPGKEVYLTDGRRWITINDMETTKEMFKFVSSKDLAGVVIQFVLGDEGGDEDCKIGGYSNISFSLAHQANHLFHQHFNESRAEYTNPTAVQLKLLNSSTKKRCELVSELKDGGIPSKEFYAWTCVAVLESGFSRSFSLAGSPDQDIEKCSKTKFGIFGLQSPICATSSDLGNKCGNAACTVVCKDLANEDITNSIKCLLNATKDNGRAVPASWPYCSDISKRVDLGLENCHFSEHNKESSIKTIIVVAGASLIVFLILLAAITVCVKIRIRRQSTSLTYEETELVQRGNGVISNPFDTENLAFNDAFEINSEAFAIDAKSMIGSGEFGVVYKAKVGERVVAAKTLKPFADKHHLMALLGEIKVMMYLEKHENVVEFVGAFTKKIGTGEIYVFMEYCGSGSLENYLRKSSRNCEAEDFPGGICRRDLLIWSNQIASGMLHLASKNVIHGDLSAKNILLNSQKVAKVSDFGFSRRLYNYTNYVKKGQAPLPWRWMSPEALKELTFSTKSDVWSFGVTLWEIFSLGTLPYPGLSYSTTFVDQLIDGSMRLPMPKYLDDVIFDSVFLPTWSVDPKMRPGFDVLEEMLHKLVDRETNLNYTVLVDQL